MQEHDEDSKEELSKIEAAAEIKDEVKKEDPELTKALADGYNPNHPDGLSPREFNLRGPLFEKIADINKEKKRQAKEISELKNMIAEMSAKMTKAEARVFEREAHEIQRQRMEAVEYGDRAKFEALDKQYQELQATIVPTPAPVNKMSSEAQSFVERNSEWFNYDTAENQVMYDEAVAFEARYLARRELEGKPPLTHAVLGKRIEEYIKTKYPHRFENPEKEKPAAVAAGTSISIDKQETASLDDLTPHQQEVYKRMKAADPSMTVDKYQKSLSFRGLAIE